QAAAHHQAGNVLKAENSQQREGDPQDKRESDTPENGAALLLARKRGRCQTNGNRVVASQGKVDQNDLEKRRELRNHVSDRPPRYGGGAGMLGTKRLRSSQIMVAAAN